MALALPALVVYGLLNPHPEDMRALKLGDHETALLIGEATGGGGASAQRLYVVIPRVFSSAGEYEVDEWAGSLKVSEARGEVLTFLSIWVVCLYALWYFWIRPFRVRWADAHNIEGDTRLK